MHNPFRYFNSSPEVIRLTVMMYIRFPLSLRQVEDLLFERGIDICHETVRFWWNRFGPMFAAEIQMRVVFALRPVLAFFLNPPILISARAISGMRRSRWRQQRGRNL